MLFFFLFQIMYNVFNVILKNILCKNWLVRNVEHSKEIKTKREGDKPKCFKFYSRIRSSRGKKNLYLYYFRKTVFPN